MKIETDFSQPGRAVMTLTVAFVDAPIEFDMGEHAYEGAVTPDGQTVGGWVCTRPGELAVYEAVLIDGCEGQHGSDCERCETARRARAWLVLGRQREAQADALAVPHFLRLEPET